MTAAAAIARTGTEQPALSADEVLAEAARALNSDGEMLERVAAFLNTLADCTGDARLRRAARTLKGDDRHGGRHAINDAARLAEVQWLVETKRISASRAAYLVARTIPNCSNVDAAHERLRRKYRDHCARKLDKTD